jgi:hypothetical protein
MQLRAAERGDARTLTPAQMSRDGEGALSDRVEHGLVPVEDAPSVVKENSRAP